MQRRRGFWGKNYLISTKIREYSTMSARNLCRLVKGERINLTDLGDLKDISLPANQSSVGDLLSCRRLYLYKHKWGLRFFGTLESTPSTRIGSLAHEMFERGSGEVDNIRREVTEAQQAMMQEVRDGNDMFGDLAIAAESLEREYYKALVIARMFWEKYPPNPDIEILGKEVYVEGSVIVSSVPPEDKVLDIYGTMDEVDRDKGTGRLWIRDKKTTGMSLDFHSTGEGWSLQSLFYPLLCQRKYNTLPFGFIYDRIQVPGIKYCGKDKDFDAYLRRVKKWYEDKGEQAMQSKAIVHTTQTLVELQDALRLTYEYKHNRGMDPDEFPRDPTGKACKPFINKVCPYRVFCEVDKGQWPGLITRACIVSKEKNNAPESK